MPDQPSFWQRVFTWLFDALLNALDLERKSKRDAEEKKAADDDQKRVDAVKPVDSRDSLSKGRF